MFPQHDEDYLKEVFNGSLDLPDAIDEVLKSENEQGKKCILYLKKCRFCERKVDGLWKNDMPIRVLQLLYVPFVI